MPYNDDGLIDPLETPNRHDSPSNESGPSPDRRSSRAVLLFALVALFIAAYFFLATVRGHPIGFPFVAMVGYTLLIALFALKSRVPWDRLTRGKFLLEHCLALAVVYGITAGAPTAEPHFPTWFTTQSISWRGARFSSFDFCLMVILFALAICEFFWRLRPEHEDAPEGE